MVDNNRTPLDLDMDNGTESSQDTKPRGTPDNNWLMLSAAIALGLIALWFIFSIFSGASSDDVVADNPEAERDRYEYREDNAGIIVDIGGEQISEDTLASVDVNRLSDTDREQIGKMYEQLLKLEEEHKEALSKDRQRRYARIAADGDVTVPANLAAEKDIKESQIREALGNHFQGGDRDPAVEAAIGRIAGNRPAPPNINTADLAAAFAGGGGVGSNNDDDRYRERLAQKEAFNNRESSFASKGGYRNFNTFDTPTVDVHTPLNFILVQPIDTRTPSNIQAQVASDVYDSTGTFVVVPSGTKAIGRYNSDVDYGNPRLQITWERLTFPPKFCKDVFAGSQSCNIPIGAIAHDRQGLAGVRGKYNQRILSTIGFASLFSIISVGPAWLIDQINPDDDREEDEDDVADGDPNEIICITTTTTVDNEQSDTNRSRDNDSDTDTNNDGDTTRSDSDSDSESSGQSTEMETRVEERCAPRFTFTQGGATGGNNISIDGAQNNTDTRDLYEDIAREAYERTDERLDTIYDRLAQRRPYIKIPEGYKFVVYPADDIVFPKGNYEAKRSRAPWSK